MFVKRELFLQYGDFFFFFFLHIAQISVFLFFFNIEIDSNHRTEL